jgi:hypothetical protein
MVFTKHLAATSFHQLSLCQVYVSLGVGSRSGAHELGLQKGWPYSKGLGQGSSEIDWSKNGN